jgi:hypothetical protein
MKEIQLSRIGEIMSPELDEKLCKAYPTVFAQRDLPPQKTCMCWGFDCGDGWYKIIDKLSAVLEKINQNLKPDEQIQAIQVKEKFGGLRYYINFYPYEYNTELSAAVKHAEEESQKTCEGCGASGTLRCTNGWYKIRCDQCCKE